MDNINSVIKTQITNNNVVLYMKGDRNLPYCGFSAKAVKLLNLCKAEYITINVLEDEDIRNGIKEYSNWPTIPQLFINGEFIGGSDIIEELYANGELQKLLGL